jgi:2-phosphosulfolactate phosphatase
VIDVALSRADARPAELAVVIDVLRATSTIAQALAAGYERVLCVDSVQRARTLRAPGRMLAGERRCVMPPGFDLGNSPREMCERRGVELVLATTNGTPAIVAARRHAPVVLLACMLNLSAVDAELARHDGGGDVSVQLVCAGRDGGVALEDVYVAGRLAAALPGPRTDATRIAEAVAASYRTPLDGLAAGSHAAILRKAALADDLAYCSRESTIEVVPVVESGGEAIAVAVSADRAGAALAGARKGRPTNRCLPMNEPWKALDSY